MSKESLEQFMNQVADSEELQARIGEEIDAEALIALGAEHDCDFTADDLAVGAELSDEELDGVAGGHQQGRPGLNPPGYKDYDYCHAQGVKFRIGLAKYGEMPTKPPVDF